MAELTGKRALVCGASAGIGRATAVALAKQGAQVIALARRLERLELLKKEIEDFGGLSPILIVADLDQRENAVSLVKQQLQEGFIHILINNSGGPKGGPLQKAEVSEFEIAFNRHVLCAHRFVQTLLPGMEAQGYGRIINIISTSVYEPIPNLGVSNTIRGAMASWAKSLSRELAPGITINNVLPGFTDTERLDSLKSARAVASGTTPEAVERAWLAQVPEGRLAQPQETAGAIAWLAGPQASYIRGISLAVDGGRLKSI
ncbi:MAG: short-chain dehydrogenase [Proteobacteria bacterium]|nr:short-chain dehydrogenase [Pseudomonadota bacterium]